MALVKLGWDVVVVIPASQQSWIAKAHQIRETIKGRYYYPREQGELLIPSYPPAETYAWIDGEGEISETQRPLKPGEAGEWIPS